MTDIAESKCLEDLTNIKTLRLGDNQIKEIKSLEHLVNLQILFLSDNHRYKKSRV
ncbi:leucine-rich repeat domain-containing protein [Candidatus Borrarchaeum sp.]|uniref:leucine-rich repeat domain-containing protein n=1 Tax=Candidatus Borrarchaeum sp. TaxID=2846742 RepID=UPI0034E0A3A5